MKIGIIGLGYVGLPLTRSLIRLFWLFRIKSLLNYRLLI